MPTKARTTKAPAQIVHALPPGDESVTPDSTQDWDAYVEEARPDVPAFRKRLKNGTYIVAQCPSSDQMDALAAAQMRGDSAAMIVAAFGAEQAPKVLELTAKLPFTVRVRLVNDVMMHYGMSLNTLPESAASPG